MRVLLTGMSGTGKSALVEELRRRGHLAYDADDDGFSAPRADGRSGWRADKVADLLAREREGLLFFAGCSEEQRDLPFDYRVLLTAPRSVLVERLRTRTSNAYGRDLAEAPAASPPPVLNDGAVRHPRLPLAFVTHRSLFARQEARSDHGQAAPHPRRPGGRGDRRRARHRQGDRPGLRT